MPTVHWMVAPAIRVWVVSWLNDDGRAVMFSEPIRPRQTRAELQHGTDTLSGVTALDEDQLDGGTEESLEVVSEDADRLRSPWLRPPRLPIAANSGTAGRFSQGFARRRP